MVRSRRHGGRRAAQYGRPRKEAADVRAECGRTLAGTGRLADARRQRRAGTAGRIAGDCALFVFVLFVRGMPVLPPSCRCVHESPVG
ncbi:hypothetical protein GCM10010303_79200 [Streptomyces purpurascens]|nr:hypothetical protein GCM10010303_79200 [Streptomyces purpurascens]